MIFELNYEKGNEIDSQDMTDSIEVLSKEKNTIDKFSKQWNTIKKKIHIYEYIYTSPNINTNISRIIPISRSYFKLTEMINKYKLFDISDKVNCLSMAEAPGGFIQSLLDYSNKITKIYASSLLSEDKSVPYWNRKLINNKLIEFIYGSKENGDLRDIDNLLSLVRKLKDQKIYLITGDGGFDYTNDYNKQEINSLPLIYGEIFLALNVQDKNGIFICKVFDLFIKETIKLIYVLILSYDKVYIHKPCISRLSNSEKYIICKGFKGYNKDIINILVRSFDNYNIDLKIDANYEKLLKIINSEYMNKQIQQINTGVKLIESNFKSMKPTSEQINNSISWCDDNNIPINRECYYLNRTPPTKSPQWS
jgi:23S rRNA U2552 (ribose-2'-O)-methylase RlmE/FtsJ